MFRWFTLGIAVSPLVLASAALNANPLQTSALQVDSDPAPDPPSLGYSTFSSDWGDWRQELTNRGINIDLTQISDLVGNRGGNQQGWYYDGLLIPHIDVDLSQLAGWSGASLNISGYVIQGGGMTEHTELHAFLTPTNIEYSPAVTKLGELWFQQTFFDDRLAVKLGQIEADIYFNTNASSDFLVNSTWGWLGLWSADLPGSGPTYPNPVPAIQVIFTPDPDWTLQAAVFNGDPYGNDPEGNSNGLRFPLGQGGLTFVELAYAPGTAGGKERLPQAYKLGGWYHSGSFNSLTTAANGFPLYAPQASEDTQKIEGNYSLYATLEQPLWYETEARDQGLNVFGSFAINPQEDRNLTDWLFDIGLTYTGLIGDRSRDRTGIGFTWLNMSSGYADSVRNLNAFTGTHYPIPHHESFVEVDYQAVVTPWLSIQPFFQYLINPGLNQFPPANYANLTLFGLRVILSL